MRYFHTGKSLVNFLAFGNGGAWLATSSTDHGPSTLQCWDPRSDQIRLLGGQTSLVANGISAARNADLLAVVTSGGIALYNVTLGRREILRTRRFDHALVAVSDSGKQAAVCRFVRDGDDTTRALDVYQLTGTSRPASYRSNVHIRDMTFSPDHRYLACSGTGGFTLWDLFRGESVSVESYEGGGAVAYSPTGISIATVDRNLVILRRPSGDRWTVLKPNGDYPVRDVCYSPDGRILATAAGTLVQFWDAADAHPIESFDWRIGEVRSVAFAPDGLTAAAGGSDRRVVAWDVET